jgi:MerR HTH family regulatory protein
MQNQVPARRDDLRIGEVADMLGISPSLIRQWEQRFGLRQTRTPGGHRRYSSADIEQLRAMQMLLRHDRSMAQDDDDSLLLATTRALVRARTVADLRDALIAYVRLVGGDVVSPEQGRRRAFPFDLSMGEGEPVVAIAEKASVARLRLEGQLGQLFEDARYMAALLRRSQGVGSRRRGMGSP